MNGWNIVAITLGVPIMVSLINFAIYRSRR